MAKTKIEWADWVWNVVDGCTKVSEGCRNCYAERIANRFWKDRKFTDVRIHEEKLGEPLRWKKPRRVFVNSMSDLFHKDVPFEFLDCFFAVMGRSQVHTFMVLTKRPARMLEYFQSENLYRRILNQAFKLDGKYISDEHLGEGISDPAKYGFPNIWLGVSVETQKTADERIPLLLDTPAAVRFVSCEPLLAQVILHEDWMPHYDPTQHYAIDPPNYRDKLGWVICGGESGPVARPMHPDWARGLRDACQRYQVPYFFKQWGEWAPGYPQYGDTDSIIRFEDGEHDCEYLARDEVCLEDTGRQAVIVEDEEVISSWQPRPDRNPWWMARVGKKAAGRELDGRTWDEVPGE